MEDAQESDLVSCWCLPGVVASERMGDGSKHSSLVTLSLALPVAVSSRLLLLAHNDKVCPQCLGYNVVNSLVAGKLEVLHENSFH